MKKYIALLRGINVGGNNKIKMPRLKQCFEDLGYENVVTYINSGNLLFETKKTDRKKLVKEIEKAIEKKFRLKIRIVLRTNTNIRKICKEIPENWVNDAEYKTDVMFLWDEFAKKSTLKTLNANPKVDTLLYIDKAIVWHVQKKDYSKSGMGDIIGTEVYKHMTVRNINTVRKIDQLFSER